MKQEITKELLEAFIRSTIKEGFVTSESKYASALISIKKNDMVVLSVMKNGLALERDYPIKSDQDKLEKMFSTVREAHHLYETAKPLLFKSIANYRLISEFGEFILAAKMDKANEVNFTTWEYDYEHTGVVMGHYYDTNYEGAKEDFAIRAGLIDKDKLFKKEELASIYEACVFRGRNDVNITYDDEKLLRSVMDKVDEDITKQGQKELSNEAIINIIPINIDAAILEWNGDGESKARVLDHIKFHCSKNDTPKWLENEYSDISNAFIVEKGDVSEEIPWIKVQERLEQLVSKDKFFVTDATERFTVEQTPEDFEKPFAVRDNLVSDYNFDKYCDDMYYKGTNGEIQFYDTKKEAQNIADELNERSIDSHSVEQENEDENEIER